MKSLSIALILVSSSVFAQETLATDKPVMAQIKTGKATITDGVTDTEVLLPPGTYFNDNGMKVLEETFRHTQTNNIELKTQNDALKKKVDEIAAEPVLSVKAVVVIVAGALLVGAGAATGIVLAVHK